MERTAGWINGGFWLHVGGFKIDILLREIAHVQNILRQYAAGRPQMHCQVGHPHDLCTVIYAGRSARTSPCPTPARC